MEVRIKKLHPDAVIPSYAKPGDAGMDLVAISCSFDEFGNAVYGTGLAMEIPEGYVGLLFPRSSNSKQDLSLCNSVGVVDSAYRGEVILKFKPMLIFDKDAEGTTQYYESVEIRNFYGEHEINLYQIGDRAGQIIIIPYPYITFIESDELSSTVRGESGFGSSGK